MTGSTAISKELIEIYDGENILFKHSNIEHAISKLKIDISKYYVFTVYRDPIDQCFSKFSKIKINHKNSLDLNKIKRKSYLSYIIIKKTRNNGLNFEEYINFKYKYYPFDSAFSLNKSYCNYIISFNNLSNDFNQCLLNCGITPKRELKVFNSTDKSKANQTTYELKKNIIEYVFGPYLIENNFHNYLNYELNVNIWRNFIFKLFKKLRKIKDIINESKRFDKLEKFE